MGVVPEFRGDEDLGAGDAGFFDGAPDCGLSAVTTRSISIGLDENVNGLTF